MNTFVVADPNKCIGCRTCEVACVVAHSEKNIFTMESSEIKFYPRLNVVKTAKISAPIQCRHCEDAPCANACPKDCIINKDGVIYINEKNCIGCKTCLVACPFGAIDIVADSKDTENTNHSGVKCDVEGKFYFKEKMVANKCDLCVGRECGPACVEKCPTNAFKIVTPDNIKKSIKDKRKQSALNLSNI